MVGDGVPVMPVKDGTRDLLCCNRGKSWMPAFAGMTGDGVAV